MPGIFISYRRSDNPDAVGRIYDRLVSEFGKARVFKDVDSIPLGQDFRGHLNDVVGACSAVLAVIGPRWTDARNAAGQRRLDDIDDFVRIELEAALARNVPVVPVLVGHATMPGTADLPVSLASMVYRQAIEVRPDPDFHHDSTRLVAALRRILDPNAPEVALPSRWRTWMTALAAIMFVSGLGLAIASWYGLRSRPLPEIRTEISTPEADRPQDFALSPDGRHIAFAAKDGEITRLWLRPLDSEVARPLPGSEGAMDPFWSPDSMAIAFFTADALKRFDLVSGLARQVVARRGSGAGGGSWSDDGVILFSKFPDGIMQVPAAGGEARPVTRQSVSTERHVGPYFLPDGRRFIYSVVGNLTGELGGIYIGSMDGGAPVKLVDAANRGKLLPSGWLVWEKNGTLLAQRLDVDKSSLVGDVVTIADRTAGFAGNSASVANTGLIAFRRGGGSLRQLQWLDRSGAVVGTIGNPDSSYGDPRVSPDGRRIAVDRTVQGNTDIWLFDGPRLSRFTSGEGAEVWGVWLPDGRSLAFTSASAAGADIFRKSADGSGAETRLTESGGYNAPVSISPDGRYLLYERTDQAFEDSGLILHPLEGGGGSSPWLQTKFKESMGVFSPDGRWIAYCSNAGGSMEVYVRPFYPPTQGVATDGREAQWQVSAAGGSSPTWRSDGREIYFISPKGEMMATPVSVAGRNLSPGTPVRLFESRMVGGRDNSCSFREYDVAPDGRFLVNTELNVGAPAPIVLIQNWNPEAKH